jgi:NurA-like 5'-3' nuclease
MTKLIRFTFRVIDNESGLSEAGGVNLTEIINKHINGSDFRNPFYLVDRELGKRVCSTNWVDVDDLTGPYKENAVSALEGLIEALKKDYWFLTVSVEKMHANPKTFEFGEKYRLAKLFKQMSQIMDHDDVNHIHEFLSKAGNILDEMTLILEPYDDWVEFLR